MDQPKPLPCRRFGRTNEVVPSLGLGTAPAGMGLPDDRAVALYHAAIDLGVTYLDTAPAYGRAQVQLGEVMPSRRDEVFLATKVNVEDGKGALESLQESLRDLNTDRVDLAYVHALGGKSPDTVLSAEGALEGLMEARRRGLTRYVGFTAHNAPWKCVKALREAEVDAVMLAMNLVDRYTYDFEGRVLPEACDRDVGVAAMKVYGGAPDMIYEDPVQSKLAESAGYDHRTALRYALGLPGVALAVVGVYSEEELRLSLSWARDLEPLSADERREAEQFGRKVAREWGPHYGSVG